MNAVCVGRSFPALDFCRLIVLVMSVHTLALVVGCSDDQAASLRQVADRLAEMERARQADRQDLEARLDQMQRAFEGAVQRVDRSVQDIGKSVEASDKKASASIAQSTAEIRGTIEMTGENQLAILDRAIGTAVPVRLPPDLETDILDLEKRVGDPATWPPDEASAFEMLNHVEELIRRVPVWAEHSLLPRITVLRWSTLSCLSIARCSATAPGESGALLDDLRELEDAAPSDSPKAIVDRIESLAGQLEESLRRSEFEQARGQAQSIIAGQGGLDAPETGVRIDAVLREWEADTAEGAGVRLLRRELRKVLVMGNARADADATQERWGRLKARETSDPRVFEAGARALLASVTAARIALAGEGFEADPYAPLQGELASCLERLDQDRQRREEESWRDYQRWALEQIQEFNKSFERVSDEAAKAASAWKLDNGGWSTLRLDQVRDDMIQYLSPINVGLLDPPLQELYRRAFDLGWKRIDAGDRQVEVAKKVATVPKKSIGDFDREGRP